MLRLTKGLQNVAVYGDDIVVYSNSEPEHAVHLKAVLKRIYEKACYLHASSVASTVTVVVTNI
ncbi:hypothetical protein CLF_105707 [Clonorchis sinensis]|uniref:Reverse transcriptase domain-containing protein n=1 Tax=Clonorchis sinensis TaxID=79923 RepID=G7YE14_CLOSI|nr:hypothetical protein CLF_105707 [Clonorchis sinensis]